VLSKTGRPEINSVPTVEALRPLKGGPPARRCPHPCSEKSQPVSGGNSGPVRQAAEIIRVFKTPYHSGYNKLTKAWQGCKIAWAVRQFCVKKM
jgi:hypothetical protein